VCVIAPVIFPAQHEVVREQSHAVLERLLGQ
jgi:hypothetical protein